MGQTANYQLPYGELSDPPNGPNQQRALAEATDAALGGIDSDVVNLDGRVEAIEDRSRARFNDWGTTIPAFTPTKIEFASVEYNYGDGISNPGVGTDITLSAGSWHIAVNIICPGAPAARGPADTRLVHLADSSGFNDNVEARAVTQANEATSNLGFSVDIEVTATRTLSVWLNQQSTSEVTTPSGPPAYIAIRRVGP